MDVMVANSSNGKSLGGDDAYSLSRGSCGAVKVMVCYKWIKLIEGSVYSIKNFSTLPNKEKFRVRNSDPLIIELEGYTSQVLNVQLIVLSAFRFSWFPYRNLPSTTPHRGTRVQVTLWGPLCCDFVQKREKHCNGAYIVIFPSMHIKEFRALLSSTSATTLFDVVDIPQIARLYDIMKSSNSPPSLLATAAPVIGAQTLSELLKVGRE
ncbi:hypothetical protein V2J09_022352 [Rumex salicifolius]